MTASLFIAQLLNGLQYGIMLFLLAAGLTLVFGIMSFVNLAHGSLYMLGAYAAAVVGKWHVAGSRPDPEHPAQMGAQYYAGFLTGTLRDYFSWSVTVNGKSQRESRYSTTALTQYAIDWIGLQKRPWFLWLAYNAPHAPFHTPPEELHFQSALKTGGAKSNRSMYLAAAEAMDSELGRLLASLPEAVRSNTVVVFMGDNGTPRQVVQAPYHRSQAKGSLYQGGINVPMVIAAMSCSPICRSFSFCKLSP